jgi:molybdopterin biosynthesis enzyme
MQDLSSRISVEEAMAFFARVEAVRPKRVALYEAIGQRVAEDVVVRKSMPCRPIAAIDGWAIDAGDTTGASRRQPRLLKLPPQMIDRYAALPETANAVVAYADIVSRSRGPGAIRPVTQGEGVIPAGSETSDGEVLLRRNARMTLAAALAGALCGIIDVTIRRPVIDVVFNSPHAPRPTDPLMRMVATSIRTSGATIGAVQFAGGDSSELARLLQDSAADMVCAIGGTGDGPGDTTMESLARVGEVAFHGVRLRPGGSIGFGFVNRKPVFASPGGLIDMLAVNIVFSSPFARRMFGRPAAPAAAAEAKLAAPLPGSPLESRLILATLDQGRLVPILKERLTPVEIAGAHAAIFIAEGSRHKRVGESVAYLRLGAGI